MAGMVKRHVHEMRDTGSPRRRQGLEKRHVKEEMRSGTCPEEKMRRRVDCEGNKERDLRPGGA